jgi:hypothetical protein
MGKWDIPVRSDTDLVSRLCRNNNLRIVKTPLRHPPLQLIEATNVIFSSRGPSIASLLSGART